jgi:hypothetical protein
MSGFIPLEEEDETMLVKREPTYFEHIEMRYGVELEICIKFDPDCLKTTIEEYGISLFKTPLLKRFQLYFLYILVKVPIEIRQQYPIIGLQADTFYIFNLLEPINSAKEINFHAANDEEVELMINYKIPIFMEDPTIVCGDYDFTYESRNEYINRNTGLPIELNKSMGIECVSPILKFKGIPEITKIKETLLPFLRLIGLDNGKCFITNKSSGYHVNISARDTLTDKLIPITKYPLLLFILQEFVLKERRYYNSAFRVNPSMWSKPVYRLINEIKGRVTNKKNLFKKLSSVNDELFFNHRGHAANITYPKTSLLLDKDYSIRIKEDEDYPIELLEFRIFRSEKNMEILMDHALYALVIVMKGILSAWDKTNIHGETNMNSVFRNIEKQAEVRGGTRHYKNNKKYLTTKKLRASKKLKKYN